MNEEKVKTEGVLKQAKKTEEFVLTLQQQHKKEMEEVKQLLKEATD